MSDPDIIADVMNVTTPVPAPGPDPEASSGMPNYGPWEPGIDGVARLLRTHIWRALALLLLGPDSALYRQLTAALDDETALDLAGAEMQRVPSRPRRSVIAAYCKLIEPPHEPR